MSNRAKEPLGPGEPGWTEYHAATRDHPPRPLLVRAVDFRSAPGVALDLGCGAGNDTRYLLERGYRVTAVDASLHAIERLRMLGHPDLDAVHSTFADFAPDPAGYDLVSAQYALPFNSPDSFGMVFARIVAALRPGGILACNLFGVRDAWNTPGSVLTFHTRTDAEDLLHGLETIDFREFEGEVQLARGGPHQAHAFDLIARRPNANSPRP